MDETLIQNMCDDAANRPGFEAWPKIPRYGSQRCTITEKLDGTNAQILIYDDPAEPIRAGSRSKWVYPGKQDNAGFAAFVQENEAALRLLGPGRHYGEWYGAGIQRRYGLTEKRLALFSPIERYAEGDQFVTSGRFPIMAKLPRVHIVPILYTGVLDQGAIREAAAQLYAAGSVAVPGWMKPEGVVIHCGQMRWKITDAVQGQKEVA